jgi:predicted glycosyltransferase involved in capsule biosynthesis
MKISFCTTCKDRLYHLKQTLPFNLLNTSDLDREFVIMDYNSEDGLYDWAKEHLSCWEKWGIVRYLRTRQPKYFSAAHAKNIAHKNATGDVLCNLDCDNFVTRGFCELILKVFSQKPSILSSYSLDIFGNHGCCGKIAVTREIFYSVNGYDEQESVNLGWGWDDVSFRYRAEMHNNIKPIYSDIRHNMVIGHNDSVRTKNFLNKDIKRSARISEEGIIGFIKKGNYVANLNKEWGVAKDLKTGLNS